MNRTFQYTITKTESGLSIYSYLLKKGFSRQNITELKKIPESILVNNKWEYVKYVLKESDVLTIYVTEEASSEKILPVALPLSIVYEDEDILVLNKAADMPIHPSQNNYTNTLANAAAAYYASQDKPFVFRCINRLDRDTTGLTILAKHMVSAGMLSRMMVNREIKREYLAICFGTGLSDEGTIQAPIGRVNGSTIERCVDFEKGEHAVTHYRKLKEWNHKTLLLLWLETGRTHQIRVHMKHMGHPLVGDFLYLPDSEPASHMPNEPLCNDTFSNHTLKRQALHAYRLTFVHPITGVSMTLTAPVPEDMKSCFDFSDVLLS